MTIENEIKALEKSLDALKKAYEKEQLKEYEEKEHKHFNDGDLVVSGEVIGVVEWSENIAIGCNYSKGYMGVNLQSGNRGFAVLKRDEFELVTDGYYKKIHAIVIELTGLEIEELKYTLGWRNCNPNKTKSKVLDILDSIHA